MGRLDEFVGSPALQAAESGTPGGGGGSRPKADFSKVRSGASSTETQRSKADFSKVRSGASSTESQEETYTVKSGDSLSKIAKKVYGNASQWKRIFEANRDQIENPDLIHPGQVLRIPN